MTDIVLTLVVSPVIQEALSRFTSLFGGKIEQISNPGNLELKKLKDSLTMMESLLKNEDKIRRSDDNAAICWLHRLQDLADEALNLLDEDAYEVHRAKVLTQSQFKKKVHNFFSPSNSMPSKIKKINESFDEIKKDSPFICQLINQNTETPRQDANETYYNSEVLGRDPDVLKIEKLLDELRKEHRLSGLSIVGMPGVGKTTLARSIWMKAREKELYNLAAWVPVPKNFEEKMILRDISEYLPRDAGGMNNIDAIINYLEKELQNKKILLILDGVWYDDASRLKGFIIDLPKKIKTDRISIVMTTSNKEVASKMDNIPLHKYELQKLSDDECWLIMEKNIPRSSSINSIEDPKLLVIGKDIAIQCGGLPLVAAVFGKNLGACVERNEWSAIRDNTAWHAAHRKDIQSQLKKCFDHLPPHLKKCFSYCSIFPKGFEIRRDKLVQLWMATRFLSQSNDSKSDKEEDVGNKYFNDLVSNYLFQDVDMDECGNIKSCKMHDELHNLALFFAKYETYIWPDTHPIVESIRHMRVKPSENLPAIPKGVAQRLHSLFLEVDVLHKKALNSRSLKSLKLTAADAKELQASLGNSKYYMKYLDISESKIKKLPKSVTELYNLQTLRFMGCSSLEKLPSGIENLVSLRHIYFDDERHVPSSIGKLTSLQTLPLFVVGTEKGQRIEELKSLSQLRGKLKICKLEQVSQSEASEAKLEDKGELTKLQFVWSKNRAYSDNDMGVLEGLQPHSNLKSLTIENYRGGNCPSWMMKDVSGSTASFRLNSLVKLKLIDCDECSDISFLQLLPELKVLNIKAMPKVKRIGRMFYHQSSSMASSSQGGGQSIILFPALRKLKLSNMIQLEEWTGAQGFPRLEELHIQECPKLKTWWQDESASPNLSVVSIQSCPNLQVIPSWLCNFKSPDIKDCPKLKGNAEEPLSICFTRVIKIN